MRHVISIIGLAVALGCAAPKASPPPLEGASVGDSVATATERSAVSSPRVPMTVEWLFQSEERSRLALIARVNRNAPIRVPTTVTVTVPAGLRVASGRTSWVIEGSESTSPVEELLVFEILNGGAQDIVLAADAEGANFGVHAKKVYSLGTPAHKTTLPPTPGPTLEIGGRDFGPSVPAKP